MTGTSWKLRAVEIYDCNKCGYRYIFPRYGDILKITDTKTGRCSEWSMLFGGIMNALNIETRIVHDYLDHCWNEALINGKWVHIDSTLDYPISLNHPYYYEQNWGKKYEYILAFSGGGIVEDVTQKYTKDWDAVLKRRRPKFFRRFF
jgi:peptide-N4-(N-acetyl-beta-glucosaminyl)asparagine amidase